VRFHHVGVACRNIATELSELALIGYHLEGAQVHDPIQQVLIQFVTGGGPRLELIQPVSAQSPVNGILKRGSKFYHLAYEVDQLETAIDQFKSKKFLPVAPPAPAVAFEMRRIVFLASETFTLIELIEGQMFANR
jgi:methylmalonyl-CoA/ethylmalonyl-CoA epimerase